MTSRRVLFLSSTTWRASVADAASWTEAGAVGAPAETADAIAATIGDGTSVTLALASALCLPASIAIDDLPRRERRQAMLYRLEEHLPLAAEDVACDFIESADRGRALGIATRVGPIADLVAALEARGLAIETITPAATLALATIDAADADVVCWRDDAGYELFTLDRGRPTAWYSLPDQASVARHVAVLSSRATRPIRARVGGDVALGAGVTADAIASFDPLIALREAAGRRTEIERRGAWVELRRDGLAGGRAASTPLVRSLAFAAVGVAALFLATGVAALYRAAAHDRIERATTARLEAIYAELFPRTPVPIAIRSRLTAEARRVAAPQVDADGARPATARTLFNVLARVPADGGFSVRELRIAGDDGAVTLEGDARSFADAQSFAAAIRGTLPAKVAPLVEGTGLRFDVDPPRTTQRADKSVSFAMTAKPVALPPSPPAKPDAKPPAADAKAEVKHETKSDAKPEPKADVKPSEPPKPTAKSPKRGGKR